MILCDKCGKPINQDQKICPGRVNLQDGDPNTVIKYYHHGTCCDQVEPELIVYEPKEKRIFLISGDRELANTLCREIGLRPGLRNLYIITPSNHTDRLRGFRYNKQTDIVIYGYYGDYNMTEVFDHLMTNGFV